MSKLSSSGCSVRLRLNRTNSVEGLNDAKSQQNKGNNAISARMLNNAVSKVEVSSFSSTPVKLTAINSANFASCIGHLEMPDTTC